MITNRYIEERDYQLLSESLEKDRFHQGTDLSFFLETNTVCTVYEDETGPILFVRGKPVPVGDKIAIKLDIQYLDNKDVKRNLKAMVEGFPVLEEKARENGFSAFYFDSIAPLLKKFCVRRLGFVEFSDDLLVKLLDKPPES